MNSSATESARLKILVLTFTPIKSEPRALKQIRYLSRDHDVTSAGFGPAPVEGVPHIELDPEPPLSGVMRMPFAYGASFMLRLYPLVATHAPRPASARPRLSRQRWDVIIAHDVLTVPLARSLKPRIGVLVDLHEYAPRQGEDSLVWRTLIGPYYRWILRRHVSKCAAVTTVGQGIVDEYRNRFGIESTLVVNATPFRELEPTTVTAPIRLVHSGIPAPHRKLEVMIDAVKLTRANVTLDLYLMPSDDEYLAFLRERAGGDERIRFREPVPYAELIDTLHQYDVGLSLIAPTTFNLAWCLPNKFFDFIQARLGVITGPSPEMVAFIDEYGFGLVADDFTGEALARVLDTLTPEKVAELKDASHRHAHELSGERQSEIWGQVVAEMAASAG